MEYSNSVERIFEDPRVTKPYTEEQWAAIEALGYKVDKDLETHDVRLTMGGEPTFVSIDDMEAEEWNTGADGEHKRKLALELTLKLKEEFGQGGLLHYGLGKWYPGEQLPRWQYSIYWRKDNLPISRRKEIFADVNMNYGFGTKEAQKFAEKLVSMLNLSSNHIIRAYEDVLYYFWSEGHVPVDLDPAKKDLKESLERQFLAELLEKGLGETTGYVIPLEWSHNSNQWLSSRWKFRKNNLYLIPGNSPMGLRLPLDSLQTMKEEEKETIRFLHGVP